MTRINLIKPSELSDQHLIAEYREIFMVGSALQRSIKSKSWEKTKENLPREFTLNIGHVKFFYNKGKYLHKRYLQRIDEMQNRGMNPNLKRQFKKGQWPNELYKDWNPKEKDFQLINHIRFLLKERGLTINGVKNILNSKINKLDDTIIIV